MENNWYIVYDRSARESRPPRLFLAKSERFEKAKSFFKKGEDKNGILW